MDPTEDLSARVLLKHILSTEPPRTPMTRSVAQSQSTSGTRRSSRLSRKDADPQTPQNILRRSLKHKLQESITRKSLPATKRRTASVVLRKAITPAPTSLLLDDENTPRHILMNILRTEPVKSPVIHEKAASEEPQPSSANSSVTRKRSSLELSGLDLPDMTFGAAASTAKGLSRKRPRRSLNVTAFEKHLKDGQEFQEENEESEDDHSSLSLSSSNSLSLKTPFVDVGTEKRGLQRRVSNRRKITEEEFGAAVEKRQMGGVSSFVQVEQGLSETTHCEGFTLGLSKLSEPDITTDILHCNTALYAQPHDVTSNFSIVATQDKPTVMASQIQRQMEQEEQMETEHSRPAEQKSLYAFPTEEVAEAHTEEEDMDEKDEEKSTADDQVEDAAAMTKSAEEGGVAEDDAAETEEEEEGVEAQTEEDNAADSQTEQDAATRFQSEEEEAAADSQTEEEEEEAEVDSQSEEDAAAAAEEESQAEEEEVAADSQTEEEEEEKAEVDSQSEEDAAAAAAAEEESQAEEEEVAPDSQTEEEEEEKAEVDSQSEEDAAAAAEAESQAEKEEVAPDSQSEEEEGAVDPQSEEEEDVAEKQSDQEDPAADAHSEEEGYVADSQPEDEHDETLEGEVGEQVSEQLEHDLEHISRRAQRSEGGLIKPVTETDTTEGGWTGGMFKAHSSSLEMESHKIGPVLVGTADCTETSTQGQEDSSYTDDDKENSFHLSEVTPDIEENTHLSDDLPEDAAAQEPAEQEEELEDEEEDDDDSDDIPSKTPAFVREKINFFKSDPLASPSVFRNTQPSTSGEALPAAKPKKQVRQRRKGPTKQQAGLPKSYLMAVFKHFAKTTVSADVYPVLQEIMDKYFDRLADDLETFAAHGKRKTIEVEDAELLLRRQGHVNDKVPVEVLIEKYLRLDQRKLLIPIATSGNVVIPKKRK